MGKRLIATALAGLALAFLATGSPPTSLGFSTKQLEATIVVDAAEVTGTIRSLQGINGSPRGYEGQSRLFRQYEDIGVDYVRTHDLSFDPSGPANMHVIFPDLQADPNDENSYDFASTDRELEAIKRVGAEILFRLGESSHSPVKYVAPADHDAWAQAAVHVAMHYNDGWANGFHWNIEYWEVWGEPDMFWTGEPEEYYQLYEAVARALKTYDTSLKVGGPALAWDRDFLADFLAYCRDHRVPLDFVSWHQYPDGYNPYILVQRAQQVQRALEFYGFTEAENLLTEWNIAGQCDYEHLRDATAAAWTASVLIYLQDSPVSIANRYRSDGCMGLFTREGFYTKPAYAFLAFRRMLDAPQRLSALGSDTEGYAVLAGRADDGQMVQILISDYDSDYAGFVLTVTNLPWGAGQPYRYERYLLDETHDLTLVESADVPAGSDTFTTGEEMAAPSVQLIRLFVPAGKPMPRITVHADHTLSHISRLLYGLNHRYLWRGCGIWDAAAQQVRPEVISRSLEIGFPVTRFPGGSVSSTYHWTDGIGPPGERPTGISGYDGAPATNEYGFDEQMLFMEEVGATTSVVVNFGTGTAQEAAAWVAYANGAVTDTTPIGVDELGVDWGTVGEWAERREANQIRLGISPHPYNIEYWEVGNELYGDWEYSWTHNGIKYAAGGTAWQYDQRVVREDDWRDSVSYSDGKPSQVFYVRYPPVVTGTQTITVAGVAWSEVADLSAAGPDDAVYEFDPRRGEIRFGDGEHGRIPPLGALILATYESGPHDGFVDYYAAMKAVDPDIKVGSCFHSDAFLRAMGEEHPYDFLAVHPYYSSGECKWHSLTWVHLCTMAGPLIRQMDLEDLRAAVELYAGERADQVEIAITEYNLFVPEDHTPTPHYGMSLDQGLYVADMMRTLIELGIPLGDLHCLIGIGEGEGWENTPVLSPYPQLIPRPAAYVLQLFNHHFAPVRVESEVEGAPLLTGSVPALEVVASTDETGNRTTLLAINKETTATITATIVISGFAPIPEARVWTLNGPDIAAFNDRGHPTDVMVTESAIADVGERFVYPFPAHSVTLIEFVANSSHPTPTPSSTPTPTPTCTPTPTLTATTSPWLYLPLILKDYTPTMPTPSMAVVINADPAHGPGPLSPLWRPGIVWQGGGGSWNNINPRLVDYWAELGGFDRIGLVRIVPELDSLARGVYSLAEFAPLVEQVRDHGGRLLVKIQTMPEAYTNTPNPPDACPPHDPGDWRYPHRYAKYGVASDKEAEFKALIQDFIRYFSEAGGTVTNPELFGDEESHPTLGMPDVLYEVWNEPNYEYEWCDTEENFWHLYQLIVEAADELRALALTPRPEGQWEGGEGLLPFTIGGPGWRHETLRNEELPEAFGAPDCLAADDPDCGAIRSFYDFLQEQGYLENGHLSWWSYSYVPREVTDGSTGEHLDNIRAILKDSRYEGHYASTLVVLGEWAPPFRDAFVDLLPDEAWRDEHGILFGKNINDDNEVGASLIPARIWDMTQASPLPDLQSYFTVGEGPQNDYLPLFKGTVGVFTSQTTGLLKAITNVFRLLNRLEEWELAIDYPPNNRLNLIATADENADRVAVLGWYHVNITPYEIDNTVQYSDLLASLEVDSIGPVTGILNFQNLTPGATYTQTVYVVDRTHSNAFTYRHAVLEDLKANCSYDPDTWERACIYARIAEINAWTLGTTSGTASVALESTTATLTADDQGQAEVTVTLEPYSVWLVVLERETGVPATSRRTR